MNETAANPGIDKAIRILRAGGVVAFPTDTLFGLGADIFSAPAVERVFTIKSRPTAMAMPVLVGSFDDLYKAAPKVPDMAWKLAERFWPGALTLVVERSPDVPPLVSGGRNTVGVRMPDHPVALALINGFGGPVTGTSANISGQADPASWEDLEQTLGTMVDHIVEGSPAPSGQASTIVDLTTDVPLLVRAGAVGVGSIETVCKLSAVPAS